MRSYIDHLKGNRFVGIICLVLAIALVAPFVVVAFVLYVVTGLVELTQLKQALRHLHHL
jgi:hypothetical protein